MEIARLDDSRFGTILQLEIEQRGRNNDEPPRVKFTGMKPSYRGEFDLSFGTYCEVYNPAVKSNDALQPRTEPCIALFPNCNARVMDPLTSQFKGESITQ